jgi:aspartate/methionine/tyrosine aminotransferase
VHAKLAGKEWKKYSESDIAIITVPNNPDANDFGANLGHPNAIFDLCYNWSTYTDNVINFDKPIMIFGLSKALGMAGSRIGWAIVQDKAVADKMKEFVDCQTLGVSQDSQERATRSILYTATRKANALRYGEAVLKERWKKVIELGVPAVNKSGMFLWSKNPEYWKALDVVGIPGEAMGATSEYVRINLGCSDEDFEELLRRITNNLRK